LSRGKKAIIEFITATIFVLTVGLAFGILIFTLGIITQGIYVYITGSLVGIPWEILETGLVTFLMLVFISILLFVAYLILKYLYSGIKAVVTNKMTTDDLWDNKCKIFEECK